MILNASVSTPGSQSVCAVERTVRAGDCPVVIAQWSDPHRQLKAGSLGSIPGSCQLLTFFSFASK